MVDGSFFGAGESVNDDPPPIFAFAPVILREGLQVGRVIVGLARSAAVAGQALTQTEALRDRIVNRPRIRVDTDDHDDDNKRVVKVSDAIKCIEDFLSDALINNPETMTDIIDEIVATVLTGMVTGNVDISNPLKIIANQIANCIRDKALRQDKERRYGQYSYAKRYI